MFFLALAILCSVLVSVIMRVGSGDGRKSLLLMNYVTCAAVSLLHLGGRPVGAGMGVAAGMGLIGGVLFLGAFLLFQVNIQRNGVTLSSAFMKLGVVVPTLLGFTQFHEKVAVSRLIGIALTVAAILALMESEGREGRGERWLLPMLLLVGGSADGLGKFYAAYGNPALEGYYLCIVFAFAGVLCALLCLRERQRPTRRDVLFGILLGIPNYYSSFFLLRALASLPASVTYPVFSCGTILLTSACGRLLFHESMRRRQWVALGLVLIALVFLNI